MMKININCQHQNTRCYSDLVVMRDVFERDKIGGSKNTASNRMTGIAYILSGSSALTSWSERYWCRKFLCPDLYEVLCFVFSWFGKASRT
jgi:hypothetical protein